MGASFQLVSRVSEYVRDFLVGEAGDLHLLNIVYEQRCCGTLSLLYLNRS